MVHMLHRRNFVVGLLALTPATVGMLSANVRAETRPALRVSSGSGEVGALQFYATDLGYFDKAGIDVQLMPATNGPANAAAVASGSLDIGTGNALSLAQARERGLPFVFIAAGGAYSSDAPTAGLVVPKNASTQTAADFVGKTIAVATLGSLGEIATRAWLDQHHVDSKTVKFVEMPFPAMDTAIATGHVDGAMVEEPVLGRLIATDARLVANVYDAIANRFLEGGLFATADFVRAHTPLVKRFAGVISQAARWANANPAASAAILQKYTGVDVAQEKYRVRFDDRLDPRRIQPLIDLAATYGTLKSRFPAADLISRAVAG